MQDDDFIKKAYAKSRVKEAWEAFQEYPPEEEWHKGKIENILKEDEDNYNIYSVGDIVLVKEYTYSDGKKGHNHLFVIIYQNNIVVPIENFGMLIFSKIEKVKYNIYKIDKKQILFKLEL